MVSVMSRCPRCRERVDPTFTTHCPECGQTLVAGVQSMDIPHNEIKQEDRGSARATVSRRTVGWIVRVVFILLLVFGARICNAVGDLLDELPRDATAVAAYF